MKNKIWIFAICCIAAVWIFAAYSEEEKDPWLENANLEGRDTPEDLYAAALLEDTLVVYANSTRIFDTKQAFEAEYPRLTVDVKFIRAVDILTLFEADEVDGDLLICSDVGNVLSSQLVSQGYLYKYVPWDMEDAIMPEFNTELLGFMVEAPQLFYNSAYYSEPPVKNWWALTEPRFKEKLYMVDPIRSYTNLTLLCTMAEHSDEMAQAYFDFYGEALVLEEGDSAGLEFWRRLYDNNIQFLGTSDEVVEVVGMPGSDGALGIVVSSKARKKEIGYDILPVYDIAPSPGVISSSTVMIVGDAPNVNTAKLFIRYLLGGADGTGEGYRPYLQEGSWPVRSDVKSSTPISYEDAGFWQLNKEWYAENSGLIMDFWRELRERKNRE